jgi:hypothetical protein
MLLSRRIFTRRAGPFESLPTPDAFSSHLPAQGGRGAAGTDRWIELSRVPRGSPVPWTAWNLNYPAPDPQDRQRNRSVFRRFIATVSQSLPDASRWEICGKNKKTV